MIEDKYVVIYEKKEILTVIIVTITASIFETNCKFLLSHWPFDAINRIIAKAPPATWLVIRLIIKKNRPINNMNQ